MMTMRGYSIFSFQTNSRNRYLQVHCSSFYPAFDTVDHDVLVERLARTYGLRSTALDWLRSYLLDRRQSVFYDGVSSSVRRLLCGVPQGSVLGPLLFLLYTADVGELAASLGLSSHFYADDSQLYTWGQPPSDGLQ